MPVGPSTVVAEATTTTGSKTPLAMGYAVCGQAYKEVIVDVDAAEAARSSIPSFDDWWKQAVRTRMAPGCWVTSSDARELPTWLTDPGT